MRWLREPMVQFVLLGAALLLVYTAASDAFEGSDAKRITMDAEAVELLAANWQRQWQRHRLPPSWRLLHDPYRKLQELGSDALQVADERFPC